MRTIFNRVSAMSSDQQVALNEQFDKASRIASAEPVAVVGIGCRFPGGVVGPESYWSFLAQGGDAISEVPPERWDADEFYDPDTFAPGRMASKWGGFLPDVAGFDADFFGISPREAEAMDPQQRVMLEVAWEALEHAGIAPESLAGVRAAVMMGVYYTEYQSISAANPDSIDAYSATGNAHAVAVGRIAYLLGLRGPAIAVDSACSSSLVTIHLACQSLRLRESDLALAGGVSLILRPETQIAMSKWGMLSPRGRCHSFDAGADGFVRGEGVGVVVLKRLTDAIRDGDTVLAVVRGSAVNQDGRSNGLTAPNTQAQVDVITRALRSADVAAGSVNLVESHGTGTALGDPIEFEALADTYGRGAGPCALGAVKTNIGHLEAAAGIAGFIKASLAVQRGQIPPNLNFSQWNPAIDPKPTRLFVPTELAPWPSIEGPRRAAVSSFGLGGTNAHVVLEQGPDLPPSEGPGSSITTLVISGKTDERVASWATVLADWIEGAGAAVPLAEVANTLNYHRPRQARTAVVCARDRAQAVAGLRALAAGHAAPGVVGAREAAGSGTVFVYSGQGSQWAGMGRQLLAEEPAFAAAVAELEPAFVAQVGFSLRDVLAGGEPVVGIERIQPVLVGVQLALTALWRSDGVEPDAVIGHSMGEVTAAVVAGALNPADGLKVIAIRSQLMSRLAGQGAVGLLELDAQATADLLIDHPGVSVAGIISPRQTVVAGPVGAVDAVIAAVSAQDRFARRVNMEVASHTDLMDPILPELGAALADLHPMPPKIPFFSTVKDADTAPRLDGQYWVDNVRQPVLFSQAITAAADHHSTFIEISPHPTLAHAVTETLEATPHADRVLVVPTMKRDADETLFFHTQLAPLASASPERSGVRVADIPPSPWLHAWHWLAIDNSSRQTTSAPRPGTLIGQHTPVASTPPSHMWQALLSPESKPYPFSHRVGGAEFVPISVLLQTLSVAAAVVDASALSDIRFENPIPVDHPRLIQVVADNEAVTVSSRSDADAAPQHWVRHCSARIAHEAPRGEPQRQEVRRNGHHHEPPSTDAGSFADLHEHLITNGGASPWAVSSFEAAPDGLRVEVEVSEPSAVAALDAAVHIACLADNSNADNSDAQHMVPASAESVGFTGEFVDTHCSIEVHRRDGGDGLLSDVAVRSSDGSAGIDIRGLRLAAVGSGPGSTAARAGDPRTLAHTLEWQRWSAPTESSPAFDSPPTLAVVGPEAVATGILDGLAEVGYRHADVDEAQCVVFVADPGTAAAGETDTECAVRLTREVADLVRRLAQRSEDRPSTLWIITRGVRESASEAAVRLSCLWGLAGVIRAEQPDLWGGLIDLPSDGGTGDWVSALGAALQTPARSILALREGELLCQEVTPLSDPPVRDPLWCRPDAAYLVTGGMGALGLLMADWLADRGARRLILAGRTPLPPRREWTSAANDADVRHKIAAIRALEMRGVAVEAVALDIGSRDALQDMLDRRDERGEPPIRGVIHSAGLNDGQLLTEIEDRRLRSTMWPKISGARTLHDVFPPGSLDFMYLTSAAGAVFGVPGQGAYASANAYLDGLARSRHRQGCHTVSLDWVAWRGLGFATDAQVVLDELDRVGSRPITPEEAFPAWEFVHTHDVAQAVMAPMPSGKPDDSVLAPARAWSEMALEDLLVELEAELKTILAGNLLIAEAEIDTSLPFAEMGLNSVMAMSIRRDAERLLGIELSATMLWNHPTITSLAAFLAKKVLPQEYAHDHGDLPFDSASNVLDDLFASVESAVAGSEGAT